MRQNAQAKFVTGLIKTIMKNSLSRNLLKPQLDNYVRDRMVNDKLPVYPKKVRLYKYYGFKAMYNSFFRSYDKGLITTKSANRLFDTLLKSVMLENKSCDAAKSEFEIKYGQRPPNFLTISPTQKCNLKCKGCYASSHFAVNATLEWDLLNKVLEDAYNNMGIRFFVISGGEPFLYKNKGLTILDLVEKWKDCFFLIYTNGTLINNDLASKISKLGNITPAISIEGYESETDWRRGEGVWQKIVEARHALIKYGIPFGVSVTATSRNICDLLNDRFYDYYFEKFGVTYMWMFQYMPIGREFSTDLMLTPTQRLDLFKIQDRILIEKQRFIADFWNSAVLSNSCISCGKPGGYFYINWDGNIMPCVFIPHYKDNIKDLYRSGKTLSDALFSSFFIQGRKWQQDFVKSDGNMLMPCLYRDHHKNFIEILNNTNPLPENKDAEDAISSKDYYSSMVKFNNDLKELSEPIWNEFLNK